MTDLTTQSIRGYELRDRLGAGGFGEVYRAFQAIVGREVAVKIILPQYANRSDFILRFETEAQLVARLEHIHIVPLYDYWRDPKGAYLVMRLLTGGSLRSLLKRGPLTLDYTAQVLDQVTSALAAAHRRGVVHRDLKPDNILLDEEGNAYLADFGIAKDVGKVEAGEAGNIVGSPAYLSPEQVMGDAVSPRTDIYCLGIMLYELLTGTVPFKGASTSELLTKHLTEPCRRGIPQSDHGHASGGTRRIADADRTCRAAPGTDSWTTGLFASGGHRSADARHYRRDATTQADV